MATKNTANVTESDPSHSARPKPRLDPALLAFARELRQTLPDAEKLMWGILRRRRFCRMKFRRQHPIDPYILDFYCDAAKLAVELDGGQHNTDEARRYDAERATFLQGHGVTVVRFWNHEVLYETDTVLEAIHNALTPALSRREREL